jgi:hypothetical protein
VPVYLYHGEVDQVIPLAVGEALRDAYCARGASVSWVTYPDAEHVLGQAQGFEAAAAWLAERLDGVPATTVCPPGDEPARPDGGAATPSNESGDGGCSASAGTVTLRAPWLLAITALATAARRRSRRRGHTLRLDS